MFNPTDLTSFQTSPLLSFFLIIYFSLPPQEFSVIFASDSSSPHLMNDDFPDRLHSDAIGAEQEEERQRRRRRRQRRRRRCRRNRCYPFYPFGFRPFSFGYGPRSRFLFGYGPRGFGPFLRYPYDLYGPYGNIYDFVG
jgi:hypothetical protein